MMTTKKKIKVEEEEEKEEEEEYEEEEEEEEKESKDRRGEGKDCTRMNERPKITCEYDVVNISRPLSHSENIDVNTHDFSPWLVFLALHAAADSATLSLKFTPVAVAIPFFINIFTIIMISFEIVIVVNSVAIATIVIVIDIDIDIGVFKTVKRCCY